MQTINDLKQERLEESEKHLIALGLLKCESCNYWVQGEHINEHKQANCKQGE